MTDRRSLSVARISAAVSVLLILQSACAAVPQTSVAPGQDLALIFALFSDARVIENKLAPDFACVSVNQAQVARDPSPGIVQSLAMTWKVPVYPGSACRADDSGVVGPAGATGTGKWLRVINLTCIDPDHCAADVSYYVANMGGGGRGVTATRTAKGWQVVPTSRMWIS